MKKYIFILCALVYGTSFFSQTLIAAQAVQEQEVNLDDNAYDSDDDECLESALENISDNPELKELYLESKKATLNTVMVRLTKNIESLEVAIKNDKANTKLINKTLAAVDKLFEKVDKKEVFFGKLKQSDTLKLSEQDCQAFAALLAPVAGLAEKSDKLEASLKNFFEKTFNKENLETLKASIKEIIASKPCKYVLIACALALAALASYYIGYGLSHLYHTPAVQAPLSKALLAISTALAEWKKNSVIDNFATCKTSKACEIAAQACQKNGLEAACKTASEKLHPEEN